MKLTLLPLQNDDVIRISCDGPITRSHVESQTDPLQAVLGPHCFTFKVLLNLERASNIDTSGISWLVNNYKKFLQSKGKLVLYSVPPMVTQFINFLRLGPMLQIAPNETAARDMALGTNGDAHPAPKAQWPDDKPFDKSIRLPG
jgi:anti-anti-sigma factor